MRIVLPLALALVLAGAPAAAQPKAKPTPRPKPPAAQTAPRSSTRSFAFSFNTSRGRLGAKVTSMTEELRDYFGAPKDSGVLVQKVEPGSPAAKAGLKVGDVITRVEGKPVEETGDVSDAMSPKKSGESVSLSVVRNKRALQLSAKLDSDPDDDDFELSIDGLGDLFKGFGPGSSSKSFFKQWHWQWPPDGSSSGQSKPSDSSQFDKRLKELEKRYEELKKKGSGTQIR